MIISGTMGNYPTAVIRGTTWDTISSVLDQMVQSGTGWVASAPAGVYILGNLPVGFYPNTNGNDGVHEKTIRHGTEGISFVITSDYTEYRIMMFALTAGGSTFLGFCSASSMSRPDGTLSYDTETRVMSATYCTSVEFTAMGRLTVGSNPADAQAVLEEDT